MTFGFRGIEAAGIHHVHFTAINGDGLVLDDLHFVPEMAPVPEPSTMLLMGSGLLLLGHHVWRRKRLQQR